MPAKPAYEVMYTDGQDAWSTTDDSGWQMLYRSFEDAKKKADEISGLVYANDGHDIIYDASGTVDPALMSSPPSKRDALTKIRIVLEQVDRSFPSEENDAALEALAGLEKEAM